MKILLVSIQSEVGAYLKNLNSADQWTIVQYAYPLKAVDNLQELAPDLIIWNYNDFPRHWKSVRSASTMLKPIPTFFLIAEAPLPEDEVKKAQTLGIEFVNSTGFFSDDLIAQINQKAPVGSPRPASQTLREARLVIVQSSGGSFLANHLILEAGALQAQLLQDQLLFAPTVGSPAEALIYLGTEVFSLGVQIVELAANGTITMQINRFDSALHQSLANRSA